MNNGSLWEVMKKVNIEIEKKPQNFKILRFSWGIDEYSIY